jgi:hypothetical protein
MHTIPSNISDYTPQSGGVASHNGKVLKQVQAAGIKSPLKELPAASTPLTPVSPSTTSAATTYAASAPKAATKPKNAPIYIVVIHGDPTKPNDILPGGKWDEDDFYSVEKAREAMKRLEPRYTFRFLCNHDTLIDDLRSLKARNEVDLVLQVFPLFSSFSSLFYVVLC